MVSTSPQVLRLKPAPNTEGSPHGGLFFWSSAMGEDEQELITIGLSKYAAAILHEVAAEILESWAADLDDEEREVLTLIAGLIQGELETIH